MFPRTGNRMAALCMYAALTAALLLASNPARNFFSASPLHPRTLPRGRGLVTRRAVGAVIDRPPPPVDLDDAGDGDGQDDGEPDVYEVRLLSNQEKSQVIGQWLLLASDEEESLIVHQVLPWHSHRMLQGRTRMCLGVFLRDKCEGIALVTVQNSADFFDFLASKKDALVQTILTRPRTKTAAGSALVTSINDLASMEGWKTDYTPVKHLAGGRYWIMSRSDLQWDTI